jgi:hypothetical protein
MHPPLLKDRLGAIHPIGSARRALLTPSTSIPANETIVIFNWLRLDPPPYVGDPAIGLFLFSDNPTVDFLYVEANTALGQLKFNFMLNSVTQSLNAGAPVGDHCLVQVLDRDNTQAEAWIDGVKVNSAALTSDPNFATHVGTYLFGTGVGAVQYTQTCWRSIVLSLSNGSTPTQAQWTDILTNMQNPDTALHPLLDAAKGTVYADYYCGEGLDGSAVLEDQGDTGDDLAWQGGETADDVRARAQSPRRATRNNFYSLKPGYTAGTGNVDFGFSGLPLIEPVEFRALFDGLHPTNHIGVELKNAAGTDYIRIERASGVPRIAARSGGAVVAMNLSEDQFINGGDIAILSAASNVYICINGQLVGQINTGATMDLSGNCQVNMDGESTCCLFQAYNRLTADVDFCDYVCCVVQQPERILPNLSDPLIDFRIDSERLPLATSTTVANLGTGGGTLTLTAQRSTSCEIARRGQII